MFKLIKKLFGKGKFRGATPVDYLPVQSGNQLFLQLVVSSEPTTLPDHECSQVRIVNMSTEVVGVSHNISQSLDAHANLVLSIECVEIQPGRAHTFSCKNANVLTVSAPRAGGKAIYRGVIAHVTM